MIQILKRRSNFSAFSVCAILVLVIVAPQKTVAQQDITGGAALIFGRPPNPPAKPGSGAKRSQAAPSTDKIDDAIALGNAARDRNPPDLQSAEIAYRLAWKLNPNDPRPYVGLGNVYMERRNYIEAAKAYQQAIRLGAQSGMGMRSTGPRNPLESASPLAQWHAFLGAAALEEQNLRRAEKELTDAIAMEPSKGEWRAGLGYILAKQGRFSEAARSYKIAIHLQPNDKYTDLLAEAESKAAATSAQDSAIRKQLEGSVWDTDFGPAKTKGTCKLLSTKLIECALADDDVKYQLLRWEIQDGLLQLVRPSTESRVCMGRISEDKIQLNCFVNDVEIDRVWNRR